MSLAAKTIFITGATRGIGLAIALRAAQDGANIVIAAKSVEEGKLPGTIYGAAKAMEEAGGQAFPVRMDIRSEEDVSAAVAAAVERFGGIDAVVNNAAAVFRGPTMATEMKRFDLLFSMNCRGPYMLVRHCIPHLLKAANPHVLSIAPLLHIDAPHRYAAAPAFMISKFSLSLMTMAFAQEFAEDGIAFNALWPRLSVWTDANRVQHGDDNRKKARKPTVMADAAWHILMQDSRRFTGRFTLDDDVLRDAGVTDYSEYYYEDADPANMFGVLQVSHGLRTV